MRKLCFMNILETNWFALESDNLPPLVWLFAVVFTGFVAMWSRKWKRKGKTFLFIHPSIHIVPYTCLQAHILLKHSSLCLSKAGSCFSLIPSGFHALLLLLFPVVHNRFQSQAQAELLLTLLGDEDKSEHLFAASCFYSLLSRVFTHTYSTFLPLFKVTMSDSIHGLLLSVLVSSLRLHISAYFLFCFKSLHSNAAQQPGDFPPFSSPSSPSGPTKAYRDLFGYCLYPHSLSVAYGQTAECDLSASW